MNDADADAAADADAPAPLPDAPPPAQHQLAAAADPTTATATTTTADDASPDAPATAASPPPLVPPRPDAAVAGPRAARLADTYAHALRRTLAQLAAWPHFAGCYPTVAARAPDVLRQVQAQMVDKLADKCHKEFQNILVARAVVPKLNELEALISDAAERRASTAEPTDPTPPHLLPPPDILAAHLAAHLAPHQSQLNARLQTTQARNAQLADVVARQRADIEALLARLDDVVDDVRAANRALGPVAAALADETGAAPVDDAQ